MSEEKILRKVIITAAVIGAGPTPSMSSYLPVTPEQIINDAAQAYEAGAAIQRANPPKKNTVYCRVGYLLPTLF